MNSKYSELSTAQKRELSEWRDKNPEEEKKKKPCHERWKVKAHDVSAAVTRALAEMMKSKQEMDPTDVCRILGLTTFNSFSSIRQLVGF